MSDESSGTFPAPGGASAPGRRGVTLEAFTEAAGGAGVAVRALQPLTSLVVQTRNTRYHLIVSHGDEILIQGGAFFPDPTPARLDGASLGASLLKRGWIGIGLRMEIRTPQQRVVTTAVRSIEQLDADPSQPH